ncbi:DUF2752 domain-containing protein [Nanoarchaeota archaeon]
MKSWFSDVKKIFLEFVSFDSPRAVVVNLSVILGGLAAVPTSVLSQGPGLCVFKHFLLPLVFNGDCPSDGFFAGCSCPACGMTRGMSRLLHGDPSGAWRFNRMVFVVLAVMVGLIVVNAVRIVRQRKKK